MGSFYIGGEPIEITGKQPIPVKFSDTTPEFINDPNGTHFIGQAYVQYFIPEHPKSNIPIVFIHGGGMCGSIWETTPDGRDGWLNHFLTAGWPCYIVDNVERGRAGWSPEFLSRYGMPTTRSQLECWSLFRFGAEHTFPTREPFANQRFPVEVLDNFSSYLVPRWTETGELATKALTALLDKIGPAVLLCHSSGSSPVLDAAIQVPGLTQSLILIEPSGLLRDEKEIESLRQIPMLLVSGCYLDEFPLWQELERQYSRLQKTAEKKGMDFKWLRLGKMGLNGFSHMLMMDRGNEEISAIINHWLMSSHIQGMD